MVSGRNRGLRASVSTTPAELVTPFLDLARAGDTKAAVRVVVGLLDAGLPERVILVDLLAAAQREVGERWLRNDWTVVDEHLVSGVIESAVHALETLDSSVTHDAERGFVVVACSEGDWHSLPSHMFANMLRDEGFAVSFLGSSTPAEHVGRFLARHRPDALAVSCTIPLAFNGVVRLTDAAHAEGVPVIAGGCALGDTPTRAARLGADAWADDLASATSVLSDWHEHGTPALNSVTVDHVALDLDARAPELAKTAFVALSERFPAMAAYDTRQLTRTREDLEFIVRFVAATQLVDDPSVFTEFLDWLRTLLAARDVPPAAIIAGLQALAVQLDQMSILTAGILALGLNFLRA